MLPSVRKQDPFKGMKFVQTTGGRHYVDIQDPDTIAASNFAAENMPSSSDLFKQTFPDINHTQVSRILVAEAQLMTANQIVYYIGLVSQLFPRSGEAFKVAFNVVVRNTLGQGLVLMSVERLSGKYYEQVESVSGEAAHTDLIQEQEGQASNTQQHK